MAAADNKFQFVLGMDLFAPAGTKLQEGLVQTEKGVTSVIVELGPQDSGELFRLPLKIGAAETATKSTVYTTIKEPKVVIVPKYDAKVDSNRLLANPADFMIVDKWVSDQGFNSAETVLALWDALNKGC